MNRGPSLEDLINSIQQDVFDQHDTQSAVLSSMYYHRPLGVWNGTDSEMSSSQINHSPYQLDERRPETKSLHSQYPNDGRPQTPYYHSAGQRVSCSGTDEGMTSHKHWNQEPSNFTTTVHEEVRFTPSPSPSVPNRTSDGKSQTGGKQLPSPRDSQFVPQPPLEPRKSRTRSSIRRAAKLLLNRSKQVLSSSDSNIASSSTGTPSPLKKESKWEGGSSVKERLNKNRARMGELLRHSKLKERNYLSDEKENIPVSHYLNNNTTMLSSGREMDLSSEVYRGRRFHSAENINSSVLSSDSSHNSMSDMNDAASCYYLDDVSFNGSSYTGTVGCTLRRTSSGPIHHSNQLTKEIHRGYHTADSSDTDSCVSRSDSHYMAVQTRLVSGQQVKSTRDALRKLHRNQSFNGQQPRPGGLQRRSSGGPLKADHNIQPFIQTDRSHENYLIDQWKEQGARPKYSSTESLETESISHEVFPDTVIRSDSDDHGSYRGSRSSLTSSKHSRTASPCRSVRFEDDDQEVFVNGDVKNRDYQRQASPGHHRELPGNSRNADQMNSHSSRLRDREISSGVEETLKMEKRQEVEIEQLQTQRHRSPLVRSISHDGQYPIETANHVLHSYDTRHEEVSSRDSPAPSDETSHLQSAIEPAYEEVKRAKKAYSIPPNYYYDAILAHSAWDDYKRKLQEEERRASIHGDMCSTFAKNRDEYAKLSGSNLSIASQTSLSEKMQSIGHATKQKLGRVRRALSLDRLHRPSSKEGGFEKESRLKRSPSLRSFTSFLGKKKDKVMGSRPDVSGSGRERRSASMVGLNTAVQEQVDVTTPSFMRKIGRVLEIHDDGTQLVRLVKPPSGPFGFYIAKGSSANGPGIFVTRIGDGHPAKILAGLLQVGDEILEINGTVVKEEKSIDFVYDLILDSDDLLLRIRPLVMRELGNS
ncbi:hypothetical protein HOLleu_16242 [Holothuria leucospilota]|uniref:PDZ domain-containing protein n=1 Tax=Holothuria leucospilota TaxID=206669 RepID=A0A9Q1C613_HOLLE|nr:hypothetical protein HOLleu_16242 [Holothuria leucospilota]